MKGQTRFAKVVLPPVVGRNKLAAHGNHVKEIRQVLMYVQEEHVVEAAGGHSGTQEDLDPP